MLLPPQGNVSYSFSHSALQYVCALGLTAHLIQGFCRKYNILSIANISEAPFKRASNLWLYVLKKSLTKIFSKALDDFILKFSFRKLHSILVILHFHLRNFAKPVLLL